MHSLAGFMLCSYHKSHFTSTDLISADLISSKPNGCVATHFLWLQVLPPIRTGLLDGDLSLFLTTVLRGLRDLVHSDWPQLHHTPHFTMSVISRIVAHLVKMKLGQLRCVEIVK